MGGKGVIAFLREKCEGKIRKMTINDYKGRGIVVTIDGYQMLYKFILGHLKNNVTDDITGKKTMVNKDGKPSTHIYTIMKTVKNFLQNDIIPFNVFDGQPPDIKTTVKKRKEATKKATEKYKNLMKEISDKQTEEEELLIDSDKKKELAKCKKQMFYVTREMVDECKDFLDMLYLPTLIAPGEAEVQTSLITRTKRLGVYGTIGDDSDHLVLGTPVLVTKFSVSRPFEEIHLKDVLECLKLTHDQFVDLCIFSGNDYCCSLRTVGIKSAYTVYQKLIQDKSLCIVDFDKDSKLIQGLDMFQEEELKYVFDKGEILEEGSHTLFLRALKYFATTKNVNIPDDYIRNFVNAKEYYLKTSEAHNPDDEEDPLTTDWDEDPEYDKIRSYLIEYNNFKTSEVEDFIRVVRQARSRYIKTGFIKGSFGSFKRTVSTDIYGSFSSYSQKRERVKNYGDKLKSTKNIKMFENRGVKNMGWSNMNRVYPSVKYKPRRIVIP